MESKGELGIVGDRKDGDANRLSYTLFSAFLTFCFALYALRHFPCRWYLGRFTLLSSTGDTGYAVSSGVPD